MAVRGVAARDGGGHPAPAATRGGRAGTPQGRQLRPDTPGTRRPEGGPMRSMLNPDQRAGALKKLAEQTFDVVVVGGGVTGVGTALDAVSRGLSVALLEAGDLANGTSSRSGKVFHGGLRYLEQLNFSLVREALKERDLMVDRLCPHLVSPEKFMYPFTHRWERPYVGAGVLLYDLLRLTGTRSVKGHRHLTRGGVLRESPALRPDHITGGARVTDVTRDGGRVTGVRAQDMETGETVTVRGRSVVNAAGVWAEQVQAMAGEPNIGVTAAKGIHLVVPADRIDSRTG